MSDFSEPPFPHQKMELTVPLSLSGSRRTQSQCVANVPSTAERPDGYLRIYLSQESGEGGLARRRSHG